MSLKGWMGMMAGALAFFAGAGCDIKTCENSTNCDGEGEEKRGARDEHTQCVIYCGRINVCGGPRADDLNGCIAACEERFQLLPDETASLCACTAISACSDVNEGRCSGSSGGPGGSASGGSASSGAGGALSGVGGGYSAGGSSSTGGSTATGGASTGGSSTGTGTAGGAAVDAGSGMPCAHDCDCPAYETCSSGFCGR